MTAPRFLSHEWFDRPLPDNVRIGEGSWLHSSYALLHNCSERARAVSVGRHSGIYNGSVFELGPDGEVEIGDFCTLVSVIIASNARVVIGNYSFLAHQVVIADHYAAAPWRRGANPHEQRPPPGSSVILGDDVWIGARAILLGGARIGSGAVVGAASVVDFEVPPGTVVAGNPARIVGTTGAVAAP